MIIGASVVHIGTAAYRFGPFQLDSDRRRLFRGRDEILPTSRQIDALFLLVSRAGSLVTKDDLTDVVWRGAAITDNAIAQVISDLRGLLGLQPDGTPYIETIHRGGFQFMAPVERGPALHSAESVDQRREPHLAFVDGRAWVETLDLDALPPAREKFAGALVQVPHLAAPYIGLATVDALTYESRRVDLDRDPSLLQEALHNALHACQREPKSGEAWMTRSGIHGLLGEVREAIAAAMCGVTLEPGQCRHELRRGRVSWGDARLHACGCALDLSPYLALAYWLMAQVFIARGAFGRALACVEAGCAAQDAQRVHGRLNAVGLHLLRGLLLMALDRLDEALEEFARERALEGGRHVYGRECASTVRYGAGVAYRRQGRDDDADRSFHEALAIVPGHPMSLVNLGMISSLPVTPKPPDANNIDAAIVTSAIFTRAGRPEAGARVCDEALAQVGPGPAGWILPIEPSLHVTAHRAAWARTLATLADRAV